MTLLSILLIAVLLYVVLFLGKLPQLWKVCSISTATAMSEPACPVAASRRLTFALGLVTSFFCLWRTLGQERLRFFAPYTSEHFASIREPAKD